MTKADNREFYRLYRLMCPGVFRRIQNRTYLRHRTSVLARSKRWYRENKIRKQIYDRIRRIRLHSQIKSYQQKWHRQTYPHRRSLFQANAAARRARKAQAVVGDQTAVRKIIRRVAELRKWFDVEVDHIIPLSKGGAHSAENLQIIYAFENRRKGTSLTYKPKVVFR